MSQGGGWGGVYLWCKGVCQRNGGRLEGDLLFSGHDILIMHLDADVAGKNYSDCEIEDPAGDLPCEEKCPPPSATTDQNEMAFKASILAVRRELERVQEMIANSPEPKGCMRVFREVVRPRESIFRFGEI